MTTRDLHTRLAASLSLAPATRNASATGSAVDLTGYDSATLLVQFGAWTDGSHAPGLEASSDGVSYAPVPDEDLSATPAALSGAGGANAAQLVGYRGAGRFLRATLTVAGATTGAAMAAAILRGHGHLQGL